MKNAPAQLDFKDILWLRRAATTATGEYHIVPVGTQLTRIAAGLAMQAAKVDMKRVMGLLGLS